MKAEVKKLWIDALRSGEYKQGRGQLKYNDNFCCLGVLCDVYIKNTGKGKWDDNGYNGFTSDFLFNENGTLPNEVMNWAELSDQNPTIDGNYSSLVQDYPTLAELNDELQYDFNQITHIINPKVFDEKENIAHSLAHFNDILKYDFNQIADIIEKNL